MGKNIHGWLVKWKGEHTRGHKLASYNISLVKDDSYYVFISGLSFEGGHCLKAATVAAIVMKL